jgi:hypothetical protein
MSKRAELQLAQEAMGPVRAAPARQHHFPAWQQAPLQDAGQGAGTGVLGVTQHPGQVGAPPAGAPRNIATVLCFKCQTLGYYANQCPAALRRPSGPPFRQ